MIWEVEDGDGDEELQVEREQLAGGEMSCLSPQGHQPHRFLHIATDIVISCILNELIIVEHQRLIDSCF